MYFSAFYCTFSSFISVCDEKGVKMLKNMISTKERHASHTLAGQNTQANLVWEETTFLLWGNG